MGIKLIPFGFLSLFVSYFFFFQQTLVKMSSSSEKKRTAAAAMEDDDDKDAQTSSTKKSCRNPLDPLITVVVGGKEFQEYSHSLCAWSEYFDRALRSGMKEAQSKRFEFPDRDPNEWEMILGMVAPFGLDKITIDNVFTAIVWFDQLCCAGGMHACDKCLSSWLETVQLETKRIKETNYRPTPTDFAAVDVDTVIDVKKTSDKYGFPLSKERCLEFLEEFLRVCPGALLKNGRFLRLLS